MTTGIRRLRALGPTIVCLSLAVAASYAIAHFVLGHQNPALACTVALSSLTLTRDARPRRVAETAVAMVLGISFSATVVTLLGRGELQILLTVVLVLSCATLLSKNPAFALSAATQSMLVAVLADPVGGPYMRALDGSIGGSVALVAVAVLPRAALSRALATGDRVIAELEESTRLLVVALAHGDADGADSAVGRYRALETETDAWRTSLESARQVAAFSPFLRGERHAWGRRAEMQIGLSAARAGLVTVGRRAAVLTRTGRRQTKTASAVLDLAGGIAALRTAHGLLVDPGQYESFMPAMRAINDLARDATVDPGIVAILRTVVIDCMVASGQVRSEALGSLDPVAIPTTTSPIAVIRRLKSE